MESMARTEKINRLFAALNARLVGKLQRAMRISEVDAEDAVAYAWVQIVRSKSAPLDPEAAASAWLYTVARNAAIDAINANATKPTVDIDAVAPVEATGATAELVREAHAALDALAGLSDNQRIALGHFAAGFSYKEIAEMLGKTETWVHRHVAEGRAEIRRRRE